jgi:TRAP-type C4-dicarboxylate transport system permease small subunit
MDKFEKILMSVSNGMCWVSGGILVIMMILTVINVVARPFNLAPVGIPEMIGYGMVIVVCFGFAYNAILKGNVAVDMLFNLVPKRLGAFITVIMDLLGLGLFAFITWQGAVTAWEEYEIGDLSPVLSFPVTPFRACLVFGFGMLCIVVLLDLLKSIVGVIKK